MTHLVWTAGGSQKMFGIRFKAKTEDPRGTTANYEQCTVSEVEELADQIQTLADELFVLTQVLPELDEALHAKSMIPEPRHHPDETQ